MSIWSPRRINALATRLQARTYLEVGVCRGETFLGINVPSRTAVDPKFQFDYTNLAEAGCVFSETTSDEFFCGLSPAAQFDIVFLDGLHTFEQTYRDLCNALLCTHRRSAILIDDVRPNDVYSSLPSENDARRYRKAAGLEGKSWHGDTYKVVFALHDFHPSLRYMTIAGSGNHQTLVWRARPSTSRAPVLGSMEAISRLSYFDLLKNEAVLHLASEADAIEACIADITASD